MGCCATIQLRGYMKMNDKFDEDYMEHLRSACYRCGAYVDLQKIKQMRLAGCSKEEIDNWIDNEEKKFEPIQKDNYIALHGTDEEVIELAKRICPEQLESPSITLIT